MKTEQFDENRCQCKPNAECQYCREWQKRQAERNEQIQDR